MPINDASEIHDRLREFAQLQAETDPLIKTIDAVIDHAQAERKTYLSALADAESALRADILDYMASTGDLHASPLVTFRRTYKLMYDKDAALAYAHQRRPDLLRIKEELNVRKFEAAVKNGELPDFDAEETAAPTLEIHPLGELLLGDHS